MNLGRTMPILRTFDLTKATQFYIDFLGFQIDWQERFEENLPLYLQVSRGGCVLHLSEHHGDATPGARVIVEVTEIDRLDEELRQREYRELRPTVEGTDWGDRVMTVTDPFGNRLTFTESAR